MAQNIVLPSGAAMPTLGLGTWQADNEDELEMALDAALEAGYRLIDTAFLYGNERVVGRVVKRWIDDGKLDREELFVTTKLPMMGMRAEDVSHFLGLSLDNLQLDYVDLYLIHVPFGMLRDGMQRVGEIRDGGVDARVLDMDTDHVAVWAALEAEVEAGRAKAIGLSNFNESQIQRVVDNCTVLPANHQIELHLYLQQPEMVAFCQERGITVTAYSPLGSPGSSWLTADGVELPNLLGLPEVEELATNHSKSPAQVLLRHLVQKGLGAVPKSTNPKRICENIDIFDFELSDEEMEKLDLLDRGEDGRIINMTLIEGVKNHPEYPWNR